MYFTYDDAIFADEQKKVLGVFLKYNMLHVKLLTFRKSSPTMDVISWFPFDKNNCGMKVTDLVPIGKCEYTDDEFNYIEYPSAKRPIIPRYLPGCKLRISTSIQEPYVGYNPSTHTFDGLEVILVKNIARKMGMLAEFVLIDEVRSNRVVDNHTGIYWKLLQG